MSSEILLKILLMVPPLYFAIVLHEIAHGYVALKLGDRTAKNLNRINLNPLVHIDPIWTIAMPIFFVWVGLPPFGAAKPVPVNPLYFKDPRKGMAVVAIAGPITNFILAVLSFAILKSILFFEPEVGIVLWIILYWLEFSVLINIILGIFNLFPVPPLDGGRIMVGILPFNLAQQVAKLERYGFLIVILAIWLKIPQKVFLPIVEFVQGLLV